MKILKITVLNAGNSFKQSNSFLVDALTILKGLSTEEQIDLDEAADPDKAYDDVGTDKVYDYLEEIAIYFQLFYHYNLINYPNLDLI